MPKNPNAKIFKCFKINPPTRIGHLAAPRGYHRSVTSGNTIMHIAGALEDQ